MTPTPLTRKARRAAERAARAYVAAKHDRKNPSTHRTRSAQGVWCPLCAIQQMVASNFQLADVEGYLHGQRAAFLTEKALSGGGQ
ncbi:MAG TPA: hypothetical protein VG168_03745 [Bryobacteraceae bacterium]|nr:hypothetical protein [Bryobacteraceae bacterium]